MLKFALMFSGTSLLKLLVAALGWFVVPLMLLSGKYHWVWRPWYNIEDGLGTPKWYGQSFWHRYVYHAWRNPAAGLRSFRAIAPLPEPQRTHWKGNIDGAHMPPLKGEWYWFHANQDHYHGFFAARWFKTPWGWKWLDFRVGWKVAPKDAERVDPSKARWGIGFTVVSVSFHD